MRGIISAVTSAAAFLGVAGVLTAQQPAPKKEPAPERRETRRETICYSTDASRTECETLRRPAMDSAMMKRAALGLQLSPTGSLRDTIGVFVARVTPRGPAENAGIVEGDRIVSINGVDLRVNSADAGDVYASGLPARRLTREVEKLSPGKVVTLRVYSGGRVRDVQVTAGRASDLREGNAFGMMLDGGPGGYIMQSLPRMNMEDFRPMLQEELPLIRERMRELPMRLREMEAPMRMRLNEGTMYKMFAPSRVRIMGPEGRVFIYRDSAGTLKSKTLKEKSAADKAAAEKAKKDPSKK